MTYTWEPGRPTKLTPEVEESIVVDVQAGVPYELIALSYGIHPDTFYEWLRRGREDLQSETVSPYAQFTVKVGLAEKYKVKELLLVAQKGMPGWQGSVWILEKRWFKHFSGGQAELKQLEEQIDRLLEKFEKLKKSKSRIAKHTTE